jgi:ATP-binding cassette, subfamily B, bacterial
MKHIGSVGVFARGWRRGWNVVRGAPATLRIFARGLSLLAATGPVTFAVVLALGVTLPLLPVLQVWLVKLVVDALVRAIQGVPGQGATAVALACLYAVTLLLPAGIWPLQQAHMARLHDRSVAAVDRKLMETGRRLVDLDRIERPAFGDELRLLQHSPIQIWQLPHTISEAIAWPLQLGGLLLLLGRLHPLVPLVLVGAAIPGLVVTRRLEQLQFESLSFRSRLGREMNYCAQLTTEAGAAKEIRVFGLGDFFLDRYRQRSASALAEATRVRLRALGWSSLFAGLQAAALGGGFVYVAGQAGAHRLGLGDLSLYLAGVAQLQARMGGLTWLASNLYDKFLHLCALFAFLDGAVPTIALAPAAEALPAPPIMAEGLRLERIGFRYPESPAPVLRQVSGLLPAGKVTALVGANGAGKSTLVKLLTRMYDPQEGVILLDGRPLAGYDLGALRGGIGAAYQDFACFSLSLRENVAVGTGGTAPADGRYKQALAWAGVAPIAARLPRGEETLMTRRFKGGVDLSGGEWQAVALARAFVRDAALIILDEPTAAIDAAAEAALFGRFRELVRGKTALLISHRFSTVRMADHILVLEDGGVIEAGSHAELLAGGGRYATLYEMQAARYR